MDKNQIITFFDEHACNWDKNQVINEEIISFILDKGGIFEGKRVLDVACGTGVLFPDYERKGAKVTAIDISSEMVKIARSKFPDIEVICGDAETYAFSERFDVIMIHNAFPHFPAPERLLKHLSRYLKKEGRLSVAHSISEKELSRCHSGTARKISLPLPSKEKLSEMMAECFIVDIMISDEEKYIVSGVKK